VVTLPSARRRLVVVRTPLDDESSGIDAAVRAATLAGWPVDVVAATSDRDATVADVVRAIGRDGAEVLLCAPRRDGRPLNETARQAAAVAAARTDALLAHVEGDEVVVDGDEPVADDALDVVHRERPDPWGVDSFYERRKRALTLASLPREHYRRALEVGCSIGALAVDLAGRCDQLLAVDASDTAVDLARRRTDDADTIEVRRARVPSEWPAGRYDLVSVSEVGYFLTPRELGEVVDLVRRALTDDGHLLLCHWRHQPVGWPLDGPSVHEAFLATGAPVLVEHQEPDFLMHVLGRPS
jgi:hypothetical protein